MWHCLSQSDAYTATYNTIIIIIPSALALKDFISNWFPLTNSKAFASDWRYMVRFAHLKGTLFGSKCSCTPAVISDFSPASLLKSALLCTFTVYLETLGLQEWQHTSAVWVCTCQTVMCYAPGVGGSNLLSKISPTNGSLSLLRISHNAKGSCGVSGSRRSIIEMV